MSVSGSLYARLARQWVSLCHAPRTVSHGRLPEAMRDGDVVVAVNPDNPTGATIAPKQLLAWSMQLAARGGSLVVDEVFGDTAPAHEPHWDRLEHAFRQWNRR